MEEAEQRCGGEAKLQAALLRGGVIKMENEGQETLYYFRSVEVGEEEAFDEVFNLERNMQTTGSAFDTMRSLIQRLDLSFKASQSQLDQAFNETSIVIKENKQCITHTDRYSVHHDLIHYYQA